MLFMNTEHALHQRPMDLTFVGPIGQRRGPGTERADEIRIPQHAVGEGNPGFLDFLGFRARYEPREVDSPFMVTGRVGAIDITELALKAEIDNLVHVLGFELLRVDFGILLIGAVAVDSLEELGKTAAEFIAQPAICSQLKHALDFRAQVLWVPKFGIGGIVSRHLLHCHPF